MPSPVGEGGPLAVDEVFSQNDFFLLTKMYFKQNRRGIRPSGEDSSPCHRLASGRCSAAGMRTLPQVKHGGEFLNLSFTATTKKPPTRGGFFVGGEGEIRTLAPLFTTYTLSRGASSAYLSTSPYLACKVYYTIKNCRLSSLFLKKSRGFWKKVNLFFVSAVFGAFFGVKMR